MITDSVISDDAWSDVPEDPQEAFLYLAAIAKKRIEHLRAGDDLVRAPHSLADWNRQYIYEMSAIGDQLGIDGLLDAPTAISSSATMADFDARLARAVTMIRVSIRSTLRRESVELSFSTKIDIRNKLDELRAMVNNSNLSSSNKESLHNKIDKVEAELEQKRSGLKPFWILAGAVGTALAPTAGFLADMPQALETINNVITAVHSQKADEDARERQRTEPPLLEYQDVRQITDQTV